MTPFVGRNFNVTRAGIHADGLLKHKEIYNIFDTQKILNRAPLVAISNTSGLAGIACWINDYYNIPEENRISKKEDCVVKIKEWVDKEYENGRITLISDEELVDLMKIYGREILNQIKHRK